MSFLPLRPGAFTQCRAFSTTPALSARSTKNKLVHDHRAVPPYPYGPSQWFKQSNHGLYGGARIQFGNNVSEETETKTRRSWHPNIQWKRLWSVALNRRVRVRTSTRVLKTIDKVGGLDEYLLGEKQARVKELGMRGWLLRWRIMQSKAVRRRFREERERLGLNRPEAAYEEVLLDREGRRVTEERLEEDVRRFDQQLDEEDRRARTEGDISDEDAPMRQARVEALQEGAKEARELQQRIVA